MVEVEQDREQDCEGDREEDFTDADVPEVHKPAAVLSWEEGPGCGERF